MFQCLMIRPGPFWCKSQNLFHGSVPQPRHFFATEYDSFCSKPGWVQVSRGFRGYSKFSTYRELRIPENRTLDLPQDTQIEFQNIDVKSGIAHSKYAILIRYAPFYCLHLKSFLNKFYHAIKCFSGQNILFCVCL